MTEAIHLRQRQPPRRRVFLIIFAVLAVIFFSSRTVLSYYVDALWFGSLGYAEVFRKTISLQWLVFAGFFVATFLILYGWFLGLWRGGPAPPARRRADFRGRAPDKTARRAHAAPYRAAGLARNRLRDWHEHDAGLVDVRALLVCATDQRHRGSDFWQAAKLLSIRFAHMAVHHRLAAHPCRDYLRNRYFLYFYYRKHAGAWEARKPRLAVALARILHRVCVPVIEPGDARVYRPVRTIV